MTATCTDLNRQLPADLNADARVRWMAARRHQMASRLRPWVDWAKRRGLAVPEAVRDLVDAFPPPPLISSGC